jgi:hypothetical protein
LSEIEEWFLEEFGHLGFSITPTTYDPFTFVPHKGVMYRTDQGDRLTHIKITPDMIHDLNSYFRLDSEQEYKNLLRMAVTDFLENQTYRAEWVTPQPTVIDFTPKKKITKFRFND